MEMAKFTTKSLLKKTDINRVKDLNKTKKVTFNNTVKVFIDDHSKPPKIENAVDSELKFIEISIVDKSNGASTSDSFDDCKETDFFVHKVIYDNYILPENDEDLDFKHDAFEDEQPVLFESAHDEDSSDFVVHKVTDHEDDLIKKDSDFNQENSEVIENEPTTGLEDSQVTTTFSKLSIENILEHDKIIAFIDQRSLGLPSTNNTPTAERVSKSGFLENNDFFSNNSSEKLANNLVLSPPLQELSLDKIVKAHSNNILCELDISPLNSVQETDSDSDLSSEGTMIMMTTEECQKNEQHIRESLLQYQSLKEKRGSLSQSSDTDSENSNVTLPQAIDSEVKPEVPESNIPEDGNSLETKETPPQECSNFQATDTASNITVNNSTPTFPCEITFKKTHSSSLPDTDVLYTKDNNLQSRHQTELRRASSDNGTNLKGKYLTSVEIPNDVREWKIRSSSLEKRSKDSTHNQINGASNEYSEVYNQQTQNCQNTSGEYSKDYLLMTPVESLECHNVPNGHFKEYTGVYNEYSKEYLGSNVPNGYSKEYKGVPNGYSKEYKGVPNGYSKDYLDVHIAPSKEYLNLPNGYSKEYSDVPSDHYKGYPDFYNGQSSEHFSAHNGHSYPRSTKLSTQENSYQDLNSTSVSQSESSFIPRSDELEHFVHESNERVERIRKRYHVNGKQHSRHMGRSPVRGIRPRFGSTAEILQLMQKQNNPPYISFNGKNHMSWPCEETSSNPELDRTRFNQHCSSQSLSSECSSQCSIDSYCEDQLNTSCDYSITSCPSILVHERGTPEGASPPNYELGANMPCSSENPNGFVYFSMKV